jgi:hypothetical protein
MLYIRTTTSSIYVSTALYRCLPLCFGKKQAAGRMHRHQERLLTRFSAHTYTCIRMRNQFMSSVPYRTFLRFDYQAVWTEASWRWPFLSRHARFNAHTHTTANSISSISLTSFSTIYHHYQAAWTEAWRRPFLRLHARFNAHNSTCIQLRTQSLPFH